MLTGWLKRRIRDNNAPPEASQAPSPRLGELAARVADLEVGVDALSARLTDSLKGINVRITNAMRANPDQNDPQPRQDAPGSTNGPARDRDRLPGYGHGPLPRRGGNY